MYEIELETARKLAVEAGKAIMEVYGTDFKHSLKTDRSPVTEADTLADSVIVKGLRTKFPDHGILTEESEDSLTRLGKEFVWIIDPLDGTKEFIARNGEFTVNIGLVRNSKPILGVIYVPVSRTMYYASKNNGAHVETHGKSHRIQVSGKKNITGFIAVRSRSHATDKLNRLLKYLCINRIIPSGSSIKGCLVAEGTADLYIRDQSINEWDVCAMNAIVNESGGDMTDFNGGKFSYNKRTPLVTPFVISNGVIHRDIVKKIGEHYES